MDVITLTEELQALSLSELRELDRLVHQLIDRAEACAAQRRTLGVIEERQCGEKTYRLEKVRCGKSNCRCAGGEGHGPYWYAYWTVGGRTYKRYVGKTYHEV